MVYMNRFRNSFFLYEFSTNSGSFPKRYLNQQKRFAEKFEHKQEPKWRKMMIKKTETIKQN